MVTEADLEKQTRTVTELVRTVSYSSSSISANSS